MLRNAGNIVPPYSSSASGGGEAATIEFAVAALGIREIVVCGHSQCGAMKGLLHPEQLAELPAVASFLRQNAETTRRGLKENYSVLDDGRKLEAAVQENVLAQLENHRTHPTVASAMARGEVHLYGWVYQFEKGEVLDYDPDKGQFVPVPVSGDDIPCVKSTRRMIEGMRTKYA